MYQPVPVFLQSTPPSSVSVTPQRGRLPLGCSSTGGGRGQSKLECAGSLSPYATVSSVLTRPSGDGQTAIPSFSTCMILLDFCTFSFCFVVFVAGGSDRLGKSEHFMHRQRSVASFFFFFQSCRSALGQRRLCVRVSGPAEIMLNVF